MDSYVLLEFVAWSSVAFGHLEAAAVSHYSPPLPRSSPITVPSRWSVNLAGRPERCPVKKISADHFNADIDMLNIQLDRYSNSWSVPNRPRWEIALWETFWKTAQLGTARPHRATMEISAEDENNSSSPNFEYKAAHQAFRDRWKETDDTMCRHSMSFHLHHTLRSEFFASYLYLVEKIPLGKKKVWPHTSFTVHRSTFTTLSWPMTPSADGWSCRSMLMNVHVVGS